VVSEPEWAAFVALDWADPKNFWRLAPAGSQRQGYGQLKNTPEAVGEWAASLQQRIGGFDYSALKTLAAHANAPKAKPCFTINPATLLKRAAVPQAEVAWEGCPSAAPSRTGIELSVFTST